MFHFIEAAVAVLFVLLAAVLVVLVVAGVHDGIDGGLSDRAGLFFPENDCAR